MEGSQPCLRSSRLSNAGQNCLRSSHLLQHGTEGRIPSREDIEALTAAARGVIDEVAYLRRARERELRVE